MAETAKLMRKALKAAFPAVKFSVRSSSYAGGASIDVGYTDGPTSARVSEVAKQFEGGGFDGMIDLKFHYEHWLLPDGSTVIAHSSGTEGSMGMFPAINRGKPHDDAELVSFGADFVFVNRKLSIGFARKLVAQVAAYWGVEAPVLVESYFTWKGVTECTGWKFENELLTWQAVREDLDGNGCRNHYSWQSCVNRAAEDATAFDREEDSNFKSEVA